MTTDNDMEQLLGLHYMPIDALLLVDGPPANQYSINEVSPVIPGVMVVTPTEYVGGWLDGPYQHCVRWSCAAVDDGHFITTVAEETVTFRPEYTSAMRVEPQLQ